MQNVIEAKKLQHAIQILKIELNQRDLLIQNQKILHEEKCEELQEKLADMTYQRQLLQTKLDSQVQVDEFLLEERLLISRIGRSRNESSFAR